MFLKSTALVGALALLSNASPLDASKTNACAQIASIYTAKSRSSPGATVQVDGQLAYDCLNSVPLHQKEASALMSAILPYVEWQSDIEYLKAPPKGYLEPAVDIRAELNKVVQGVKTASYKSEYAFQADLFRTFNLVHDGHFRFFGDLLTTTLTFQRQIPLVSVSFDGTSVPQIYAKADIDKYAQTGKKPSALKTINGVDAVTFLKNWSQLGASQDPDALFNTNFFTKAFNGSALVPWNGYFAGSGRFGYIWPGASTTVVYQNGTKTTYPTLSTVKGNFTGITNGESVYQKFCVPANEVPATSTTPALPKNQVPGYPAPVIASSDNVISGYYLKDQPDVAVLAMLSFEPDSPAEFQYVLQTFLAQAKKDKKKKLVIDVSANGGGYIFQGYDTFRQLFPQIVQNGNNRFRYVPATPLIADQYTKIIGKYNVNTIGKASDAMINMYESPFNYKYDINVQNKHFTSEKDKLGPYTYNNDKFTNNLRWDFNDPLTTTNATYGIGIEITGYGSRAHNFTQPFAAKDIILMYDGYCASTCTLFSDFMKNQGGVKSIAFGGRPSTDAMQGIGGTKGANNFGFDAVNYYAQLAYQSGTPAQQKWANWTQLTQYSLLPTQRSSGTSLNFRDNIHQADLSTGVPAQFIYEAADCRLFYTPAMIEDASAIWSAAASAAFSGKKCVQGSLGGGYRRRDADAGLDMEIMGASLERRSMPVPHFAPLPAHPVSNSIRGEKVPL